jgi:hypothetical protein
MQLSALVLSKLLQSCPDIRQLLRSDHLVGNTEPGGGTSCLSMNNKVSQSRVEGAGGGKPGFMACCVPGVHQP